MAIDKELLNSLRVNDSVDFLVSATEGDAISGLYPTGFPALDSPEKLGGLRPGLNVLGGMTGTGKTSFALQIANNVAASGTDVLFVSLEMSANELLAMSLSQLTAQIEQEAARRPLNNCQSEAWTALEVLRRKSEGPDDFTDREPLLLESYQRYKEKIARNMYIHEPCGQVTIEDLEHIVGTVAGDRGSFPLVVIDYIQLLAGGGYNDKQNMDKVVLGLKRISVKNDVPVLAISSLSRYSYIKAGETQTAPEWVPMSAFKESGAIEYSADVLMAFKKTSRDGRDIKLQVLKNRRGPAPFAVDFNFFGETSRFSCPETEQRNCAVRKAGRRKKLIEGTKTWEEFNARYERKQQEKKEAAKARLASLLAAKAKKEGEESD